MQVLIRGSLGFSTVRPTSGKEEEINCPCWETTLILMPVVSYFTDWTISHLTNTPNPKCIITQFHELDRMLRKSSDGEVI
jgi:hypothetical protein